MSALDEMPEYSFGEILEDNGSHIIYRATRKSDGLPVVIKRLGAAGTPAEASGFCGKRNTWKRSAAPPAS